MAGSGKIVTVPIKTLPGMPPKFARVQLDPDGAAVLGVNMFYETPSGQMLLLSIADVINPGSPAYQKIASFQGDVPGGGNSTGAGSQSATQLTSDVVGSGSGTIVTQVAVGAVTDTKAAVSWKPPVRLTSTTNQTLSGLPTIDGVATAAGDLVLLTNQTTTSQNGPWTVAAGAWSRPTWYPNGGRTQSFKGATFVASAGSANAGVVWNVTTTGAITIGTNAVALASVPAPGSAPTGAAGGDLSGTYPNPTVAKINGNTLGSTTPAGGNVMLGNGAGSWVSTALSQDIVINAAGAVTINTNVVSNTKLAQMAASTVKMNNTGALANAADVSITNLWANSSLAQMPTLTIKGNNTGGTANALDLTPTQVRGMLKPVVVTGTATMSVWTLYIANTGLLSTLTLPATAAVGDEIEVIGSGSGGWKIAQLAGQTIHGSTNTTTGTGGSVASSNRYDCIRLVCITANTDFTIANARGTLTIV